MKNCTLLLSSYDGGEDLWYGFFKTLVSEWPGFSLPVVLNTETKEYSYPGLSIKTYKPCKDKKMFWSERLKYVLNQIDTDFVLLFLEDYWLDSKVNDKKFKEVVEWMEDHTEVASICFYPMKGPNVDDGKLDGFELRPKRVNYKATCQVSIWRRKRLMALLKKKESPWEFETIGSLRAGKMSDKFYSIKKNYPPVFSYGDPAIGCLIHRGKWNKEVLEMYQRKFGIEINASKRGYEDWDSIYRDRKEGKDSILAKLKRPHRFARLYLKLRNYFKKTDETN